VGPEELLNRCAFERAKKLGGRQSVSALLVDLVQRHRKELEKELDG
jgi:predicted CopG family antitoxin